MLDFPKSTIFNRRIPKQKFYEKLNANSNLERQFVKEIESIYWKNKFSQETLNISIGLNVTEIEIIEINLKDKGISKNIIEVIDKGIPYHLVFILRYNDLGQIWISFKENSKSREGKFKVDSYYMTGWLRYDDLILKIEGLNLDKVYENFMVQVAGNKLKLQMNNGELTIKEAVEKAKEREKLEAYIKRLEAKIGSEKQFNQQVKLNGELRKARTQLEAYLR